MRFARALSRWFVPVAKPSRTTRLCLEPLEERRVPAGFIAVGTDAGAMAQVRLFADRDDNNTYETLTDSFFPFGGFQGGVRVAMGDFDNDQNDELVTATGPGNSRIKIWDLNPDGTIAGLSESFIAFPSFTGGVFVAAGNLNGGVDELVVGTDRGTQARVKIYSDTDRDGLVGDNQTDVLTPFGGFTGGVNLAMGNTNNTSGLDELICAMGPGGQPIVKVFSDSDNDAQVSDNVVVESFLAYPSSFRGGVNAAATSIQGANATAAELIVAPASGPGRVKILSDQNSNGQVSDDAPFDSFFAYGSGFPGGVRLAGGDTDNSRASDGVSGGFGEVVTATGHGAVAKVKVRDDSADGGVLLSDEPPSDLFTPIAGTSGIFVAFGQVQLATATNQFQQLIGDGATTTPRIQVAPGAGVIRDLEVSLFISHENNADLDLTLTHVASGISVVLFTDVGGTRRGFIVRLDDQFPSDIGAVGATGTEAVTGGFNPEDTAVLSAFNGIDASGEWRLSITDDTDNDLDGLFLGWSLHFTF